MASSNFWSDLLALVTSVVRDTPSVGNSEGVVNPGSWNAANGTIQHIFGDTVAILPDDDDDQPLIVDDFPVVTTQIGDQAAPRGGERTVSIPTPSGYVTMFVHGPDDTPGTPAGERWILHYNDSGQIDSYFKHTNDGPTPGDGLGGAHYGGDAGLTKLTTKSGHSFAQNDTTKQVVDSTALGNKTVKDDITNEVSHVTQNVGLGDVVANIPSTGAVIANTHLTTFENSLQSQRITDSHNSITAICTALASASPPVTLSASAVIALLASFAHVSVPSGSSITKTK